MPRGGIRLWTDEKIEAELRSVAASVGHFPAAAELRGMGRNDLCCAVTKAGGLLVWSQRLGLPRAHSDSDTGWDGERAFVAACQERGMSAVRPVSVKAPFDVLVDGAVRIDVKSASYTTYASGRTSHGGWWYRIGKIPQADVIVLWQLDTGDFFGIPWWLCPTTNVCICPGGGKYARHINNWNWIRHLISTRRAEMEAVA